ncbi:undecaprenyldiphospho-muramoylpentapeptide beta-N-acetylglucosaminyltransferase [Lacticaseibacillus zhaodongensis]|uniref:undecaprenyldiphospho-muramoylpentapeptide beta-N-acetylglucosaminyltransferase n=1 Tax=Lacticaseibacillus zhaodongensis TaxID=2668065 RepID=UPI0012D2B05A|nr:undecaprenyldiphospho-muramoylpentapeptide beta-N-acetylglucosaminyltransferase [Lacticaseibacillus zhaodongensis]
MRIVVSGGGTGGHIYPALALLDRLKELGKLDAALYVGTERGLESRIVPTHNVPFATIKIQGFSRRMNWRGVRTNLETARLFLSSVKKARKILREFKPDVVVGTGGYVSGATLYAAARMHIPTVIHESNSIAGVTNKFLAHFVTAIAISFQDVAKDFPRAKVTLTGNPRAQQVAGLQPNEQLKEYGLDPKKRCLLIFGGSRGAPRINKATLAAMPAFAKADYQVLFVTGQAHYQSIVDASGRLPENVAVVPYIAHMERVLPDVSLLVSRSGATTLAELTALGLPAVLIPSPNVTHNHQYHNAKSLENAGAAVVLTEDELDERFISTVQQLMADPDKLATMASASVKLGVPDATDRLITVLEAAMKGE